MNWRSITAGVLLACALCCWCYFSDHVIRAGGLLDNLMPVAVYGSLVAVVALGALVNQCSRGCWLQSSRALTAVVVVVLFACGIPGRFTQCLPSSIMLPLHDVRTHPGWREAGVIDRLPSRMLPEVTDESRALNGFVTGLGEGDVHIGLSEVPWGAWLRPLSFWLPAMVLLTCATLGLALVFHRQWVHHEQLPYPIAAFAAAVIGKEGEYAGGLFRNRFFLAGFAAVFLIELNNTLYRWWPDVLIPVSLRFDFSALAPHIPLIVRGKGLGLLYPRILFPVVGFAYLVASDVAFSMAVGPWLYCLAAGLFMTYGVELRPGREMALSIETFLYSGGYFGILLLTLYTGRHFYLNVLRRSVGRSVDESLPTYAVYGMRGFLLCATGFLILVIGLGVPLIPAALYLLFALMVFVVVSRIVAETGAYILGTFVFPGVLIWGMFGASALGPDVLLTLFMLSTVLLLIPARAPMAFMVHALRLADAAELPLGRTARWGLLTVLLSVAIAVPAAIYWQYDRGTPTYGWPRVAATYPFENTVDVIHKLKAQDRYDAAMQTRGWRRLGHLSPSWPHVTAFVSAATLAIGFGAGRLAFRFWPLHPVIFLFLGGHAAISMSFSFFLGWLVKALAGKYGGASAYRRLKPLMFGVIAGAVLGQVLPIVIGTVRFFVSGTGA